MNQTLSPGLEIQSIMRHVLFSSWVGILLFTWLLLFQKNKRPVHYCMIIADLCLVCILINYWAAEVGLIEIVPALALSDLPLIIISIPACYLAARIILYEGERPVRSYKVYFAITAPVALAAGAVAVYSSVTFFSEHGAVPSRIDHPFLWPMYLASYALMTFNVIRNLFTALHLYRSGKTKRTGPFRKQVFILLMYMPAACVLFLSFIFRNERLIFWSFSAIGSITLVFSFIYMSVSFIEQSFTPPQPARTVPRPEWDKTAEELAARLSALMESETPYRDPDLTLPALAKQLGVDQKRLSYLFNVTLSTNFRSYINGRRLSAVCRELVEYPERSILDTAFANGFNSKSSFNTLFIKTYGKAPREFRKEHAGKSTGAKDIPAESGRPGRTRP